MAQALTPEQPPRPAGRLITIAAWDGLPLTVHAWGDACGASHLPLFCLPGFARTGGDFARLGSRLGGKRPVFALDYAGRGRSGRSRDYRRYAAEAAVQDALDVAAALNIGRAVVIGTSFGGLLATGLAAARPGLLAGVVLNDIGPEVGARGQEAIRSFLAETPVLGDLEEATRFLRTRLPNLGIDDAEGWREFARLTYAPDDNGMWQPLWDPRIARLLDGEVPNLWPLFGALGHLPALVIRGALSEILLPGTLERMRMRHPGLEVLEVPGVGHAPTLSEPAVVAALDEFLAAIG